MGTCNSFTIIAFIVFYSCVDESVSPQNEGKRITKWAPNIKYGVAYNEKQTVLQLTWPEQTVAGFSKSSSENVEGILIDYSYQKVETSIDKQGYVSTNSRYLDGGDAWMHMPPEDYNKLKNTMPAKPDDYDPPVASEMHDGQAFLTTLSGNVIPTYSYNMENYWVDPSQIDSALGLLDVNDTSSTNEKVKSRYDELSQKYGSVNRLDNFFASVQITSNEYQKKSEYNTEISAIKQVVDLRDGTIIREGIVDQQGRISNMSFIGYKKVNGFMIEDFRKTYEMVEEEGRFFAKYMTYNQRDNIQVYLKSN